MDMMKKEYTFSCGELLINLVYNSQAKLSRAAPTIWEVGRVGNIQVHGQVLHVIPLGENKNTPAPKRPMLPRQNIL
jgi:hypothetical protein